MVYFAKTLNEMNNPRMAHCPKCHYEWERRVDTPIKKCPVCQHLLIRSREPWPLTAPADHPSAKRYEIVRFGYSEKVHDDWPQVTDPDLMPDRGWLSEQNRMEYLAELKLKNKYGTDWRSIIMKAIA